MNASPIARSSAGSPVRSGNLWSSPQTRGTYPNRLIQCRRSAEIERGVLTRLRPAARDHLLLRVELHAVAARGVQVAIEGASPAGEGEVGHRRGHRDVHSDHAGLGLAHELAGRPAVAGEDG